MSTQHVQPRKPEPSAEDYGIRITSLNNQLGQENQINHELGAERNALQERVRTLERLNINLQTQVDAIAVETIREKSTADDVEQPANTYEAVLARAVTNLICKRWSGQQAVASFVKWYQDLSADEKVTFKGNRGDVLADVDRLTGITDLCRQETLRLISM